MLRARTLSYERMRTGPSQSLDLTIAKNNCFEVRAACSRPVHQLAVPQSRFRCVSPAPCSRLRAHQSANSSRTRPFGQDANRNGSVEGSARVAARSYTCSPPAPTQSVVGAVRFHLAFDACMCRRVACSCRSHTGPLQANAPRPRREAGTRHELVRGSHLLRLRVSRGLNRLLARSSSAVGICTLSIGCIGLPEHSPTHALWRGLTAVHSAHRPRVCFELVPQAWQAASSDYTGRWPSFCPAKADPRTSNDQ